VSDIDIVGGSAAGLFAGYLLARQGRRVRLFDANDVLNVDSRTLITTSRLSDVLGFSLTKPLLIKSTKSISIRLTGP
jgi:2-polyprenyl-6-methoxyphenol hydroxylase-like FAD-dependent oxidoreductase